MISFKSVVYKYLIPFQEGFELTLSKGSQTVRRYEFEQIAIQLGFRGEKFTNVRKLKYKS